MKYTVIYSKRRSICAEISRDGSLVVRAPYFCPEQFISAFLSKNEKAILKKQADLSLLPEIPSISAKEAEFLRQKAKEIVPNRVQYFAEKFHFEYKGVKITSARRRFGSCSAKKHLCFSLFLALCSPDEIDYVVLHELCHTVEMNHSARFYALLESYMPDYKKREALLRTRQIPIIKE
jgi:predicted metal-dependent hydrolase